MSKASKESVRVKEMLYKRSKRGCQRQLAEIDKEKIILKVKNPTKQRFQDENRSLRKQVELLSKLLLQ